MMQKKVIISLISMLTGTAYAGEAHVCNSPDVPVMAPHKARLNDNTVFNCENKISGTIPNLALEGWKIVQVMEQTGEMNVTDPSRSTTYTQLIIQKD